MQPAKTERGVSAFRGPSTAVKVLTAFGIIAFSASLPRHVGTLYVIPWLVVLLLWAACRMHWQFALKRLLVAEVFILGLALLWLVNPSSGPIFLSAIVKSNLCIITLLLLTWTTPFHELLQQLRRWGFPVIMLTTLALMYRYLPVLGEETRRMSRARASRTFSRRRWSSWSSLAEILGQLFIRTAGRAERIYLAMCARGWK